MATDNGTALVERPDRTPLSQRDPIAIAKHFASSGYFKDARDMSQAVVKIVAGEELGIGPMASMQGIHVIEGKPSLSANLLATLVRKHPDYDYRVVQVNDKGAEIAFTRNSEKLGDSIFTVEQAQRAGLMRDGSGWKKYPEAMCFARALSQGVRWYCPDVTAGSVALLPEELGAAVDDRGELVPDDAPEPAEVEATVVLGAERVSEIGEAINRLGLSYNDVDLMLGALGLDALRARSAKALRERIESLTEEQADALQAEINQAADRS